MIVLRSYVKYSNYIKFDSKVRVSEWVRNWSTFRIHCRDWCRVLRCGPRLGFGIEDGIEVRVGFRYRSWVYRQELGFQTGIGGEVEFGYMGLVGLQDRGRGWWVSRPKLGFKMGSSQISGAKVGVGFQNKSQGWVLELLAAWNG